MTGRRACLTGLLLLMAVAPARAQSSLGARGYVTFGRVFFTSGDSFEAVTGERNALIAGVGGQVTGLWKGLFVDGAFSRQTLDGERVFVANGDVFPLGIPLEVRLEPLDAAIGWRFTTGGVASYVGIGMTSIHYTEAADFAQPGDDVDERKSGAFVLAGVDVPLGRWVSVGGEFRYRSVAGVLGDGGVSAVYGDDQLGGVSYAVRVAVGR